MTLQDAQLLDGEVLLWNLLQGSHRKLDFSQVGVLRLQSLFDGGVEGNELEVIKLALRKAVVKLFHHIPRAISHTNTDDGQGVLGSFHDGIGGFLLVTDLTVSHDEEDVVALLGLDDFHGVCCVSRYS